MNNSSITVRTDSDTLQRLDRLAAELDRSRNHLVNQALKAYLDEQAWQIEEIKQGIAELDRGDSVPHEEVMAEMDTLIQGN